HEIEHMRRGVTADQREDKHERAPAVGIAGRAQGRHQRIPRIERQQYGQGADVEDQNPVHHLVDGLGNDLARLGGFGSGNPDQLQPAEGKHDDASTITMPVRPFGKKPPWRQRLLKPACSPPLPLNSRYSPSRIMPMTAATLMMANQNSASPNALTLVRLIRLMRTKKTAAVAQVGISGHQN